MRINKKQWVLYWSGTPNPSFTGGTPSAYNLAQHVVHTGPQSVTFTVAAGSLPAGMMLNATTGYLSYDGTASASVSGVQFKVTAGSLFATSSSVSITVSSTQPPISPDGWYYTDTDVDTGNVWYATNTAASEVSIAGSPDAKVGCSLQYAIDNCALGDTIVLTAGAVYPGNWKFKNTKGAGTGADSDYITIRSSGLSSLPASPGRVDRSHGSYMPIIRANTSAPAMEFWAGSHHWKFKGLIVTNPEMTFVPNLVQTGKSNGEDYDYNNRVHHVIFDRCWVREATNDTTTPTSFWTTAVRGFAWDAKDTKLVGCRIAGFRTYTPTSLNIEAGPQASQALLSSAGLENALIENCFMEGWFVTFFLGQGGTATNYAEVSSATFNTSTYTGTATLSNIVDPGNRLQIGSIVAFRTANGHFPPGNSAQYTRDNPDTGRTNFQCGTVTAINGNEITFRSAPTTGGQHRWDTYPLDPTRWSGNPVLQTPDYPSGRAQWYGSSPDTIIFNRCEFFREPVSFDAVGNPLTGYRPGGWGKGILEIKHARNMLIKGCVFTGYASALGTWTARNQGGQPWTGSFPWVGLVNITVESCYMVRGPGWNLAWGGSDTAPLSPWYKGLVGGPFLEDDEFTTVESGPVVFKNNLFAQSTGTLFGNNGGSGVEFIHNTYVAGAYPYDASSVAYNLGECIMNQFEPLENFVFRDNILVANFRFVKNQLWLSGYPSFSNEYGNPTISTQSWDQMFPGGNITHNVWVDNRRDSQLAGADELPGPLINWLPTHGVHYIQPKGVSFGWTDPANGNYRLASNSPYKNAGSDGKDVGCDIDALETALGFSITGWTP